MSLSIDIPSELERTLRAEAERRGLDPAVVALDALRAALPAAPSLARPKDLLKIWDDEGVIGTFADRPDSPEFATYLRRAAEIR